MAQRREWDKSNVRGGGGGDRLDQIVLGFSAF